MRKNPKVLGDRSRLARAPEWEKASCCLDAALLAGVARGQDDTTDVEIALRRVLAMEASSAARGGRFGGGTLARTSAATGINPRLTIPFYHAAWPFEQTAARQGPLALITGGPFAISRKLKPWQQQFRIAPLELRIHAALTAT